MNAFSHRNGFNFGIGVVMIALACSAAGQDKAGASAKPAVTPPVNTTVVSAAPSTTPAIKRRMSSRKARAQCQLLDDPWGDMCVVRKKAATACQDLASGAGRIKNSRNSRKEAMVQVVGNPRRDCVDAYMRNV